MSGTTGDIHSREQEATSVILGSRAVNGQWTNAHINV